MAATSVQFLCSFTNRYPYRGVTYPVVDLFLRHVFPIPEKRPPWTRFGKSDGLIPARWEQTNWRFRR